MKMEFNKYSDGLAPVIVQDVITARVLMLGFMNEEAFEQTRATGKAVFYSRSRKQLWTKGETSGNFLFVKEMRVDCDNDTLLVKVTPAGPVCHTGADTCFGEDNQADEFIFQLEQIIDQRYHSQDESSYTAGLFRSGINRVAQKVGEEAVELVIASKDENRDDFVNEAADLLFHYLVLLRAKNCSLNEIQEVLRKRHSK